MIAARKSSAVYDVAAVRADFPILARKVHGKPLVYLDSAASAQKPRSVIDCERLVYEEEYANVHRGPHFLSERASERFEAARESVRSFINAADAREIVFTRNATESINLVAASWGRRFLKRGANHGVRKNAQARRAGASAASANVHPGKSRGDE